MATQLPASLRRDDLLSDEEILQRVRGGDGAAYELLMRRYNQRMYRAVRAILGDEADVEDVMQDAYLAAYRELGGFEGRARFSTWLIRIAVNRALDRRRRSGRAVALDESALERELVAALRAHARDPEQELGARQLAECLERAIDDLPEPFRTAYVLREVEGLQARDTAECLGIPESTVHTRVHRARRLLREALGDAVDGAARDGFRFGGERCDRVVAAVLQRLAAAPAR
jgi:RNA polymerase sigma-70 factor (ECF subfamily)